MSEVRIVAESRTEFGKGPARRTRRAGKVPAVLYGHGDAPRHFALPGHELMLALKHDSNVLLTLQTEEGEQLALPKIVVRHPIKRTLTHVDLVAVRKGETVTVDVPITLIGDAAPGTLIDQQLMSLSVNAEATHLPDHVELVITGLQPGGSLAVRDIVLPKGTTLAVEPDYVVVAGLAPQSAEQFEAEMAAAEAAVAPAVEETEEVEAEAEAAEGTEAEAATEE